MTAASPLARLAHRVQPRLNGLSGFEYQATLFNTYFFIYATPLALIGLIWLTLSTDLPALLSNWQLALLLLGLQVLFARLPFSIQVLLRHGTVATATGSLTAVITWSGYFLLGPAGLWITVASTAVGNLFSLFRLRNPLDRWGVVGSWMLNMGEPLLSTLAGLWVFQLLGGSFPVAGLSSPTLGAAAAAFLVSAAGTILLGIPIGFIMRGLSDGQPGQQGSFLAAVMSVLGLTRLAAPFGLLGALLFHRLGPGAFIFFALGVLAVSLLARSLSRTAIRSQQRSRELAALEALGQDLLTAPPDDPDLPGLLARHLPSMFPSLNGGVWLWPDVILYGGDTPALAPLWPTVRAALQAAPDAPLTRPLTAPLPDSPRFASHTVEAVPIRSDDGTPLGGIFFLYFGSPQETAAYRPALQSLAAQIAIVEERAAAYRQALANERMSQELAVAGRIQQRFLPAALPAVDGWTMSATLEPARETSGDFYDFIPLDGARLGLVVADVADKGTGAALFMALSRTLLRTYALQHPANPAQALRAASERILADTSTDQFVTVCYVVVDTATGRYTYASAGHNPAYLLGDDNAPRPLGKTGPPLGVLPGLSWRQQEGQLLPGDRLVLYSDGVTEAQNGAHEEYGEARLEALLTTYRHRPAEQLQSALLADLQTFAAGAPQFDDITLLIADYRPAANKKESTP